MTELTQVVESLNQAFEEFKRANDERLAQIEKKGSADPLLEQKLAKIEQDLEEKQALYDELQAKLDTYYASATRPGSVYGEAFQDMEDADAKAANFLSMAVTADNGGRQRDISVKEAAEYRKAFAGYLRRGEKAMSDAEYKAITVGTATAGGYLVQDEMYRDIIEYVIEAAPIRRFANVTTIGTEKLEVPRAEGGTAAGWVGETAARPDTATETFGQVVITAHELYANPPVSARALEDPLFDVEAFLSRRIGQVFGQMQSDAFINGNGTNQPVGLLDATGGLTLNVTTATLGTVKIDDLIDAEEQLKASYRPGARWMLGRGALSTLRKIKDSNGQYLWQPAVAAGEPSTLMGYPVMLAEQMPAVASGNKALMLVNLRDAYMIVDRHDIRVLRDPYTNKPYVNFYTVQRVGGAVVNAEAGVTVTIQ